MGALPVRMYALDGSMPTTPARCCRKRRKVFTAVATAPPLCPLPATRQIANLYIGWQARKGTVRAGSMWQYVAAINAANLDCDVNDSTSTGIGYTG
eukprot:SAG11_NODE_2277_length_3581_cov_3.122918_4_plen_96_part_00